MKLLAHPVRTGQAGRAFPARYVHLYYAPLDPAYEAGVAGHVPVPMTQIQNSKQNSLGHSKFEFGICLGFEIWDLEITRLRC
jgi:hypothetical protein